MFYNFIDFQINDLNAWKEGLNKNATTSRSLLVEIENLRNYKNRYTKHLEKEKKENSKKRNFETKNIKITKSKI